MRSIYFIFPLLSILVLFFSPVAVAQKKALERSDRTAATEMKFNEGQWKDIAELAKKNNTYIFVDAYATWCGPCKLLKAKTFKEQAVVEFFNKNFINVTMDMEKGQGEQLAEKWQIDAYPTLLFFNPQGKLVKRALGFMDGKALIAIGKEALAKK